MNNKIVGCVVCQQSGCDAHFGPGTQLDLDKRIDEHMVVCHPQVTMEQTRLLAVNCAENCAGMLGELQVRRAIRTAEEYIDARQLVYHAEFMVETLQSMGSAFGDARQLAAEVLAMARASVWLYEALDPVRLFNDRAMTDRRS